MRFEPLPPNTPKPPGATLIGFKTIPGPGRKKQQQQNRLGHNRPDNLQHNRFPPPVLPASGKLPSKEELLAHVRQSQRPFPSFTTRRPKLIQTGEFVEERENTRFPPRQRPTPATPRTTTTTTTRKPPVRLNPPPTTFADPEIPPIVTYPPGEGPFSLSTRRPRVKSDLQLAQRNMWRRKPKTNQNRGNDVRVGDRKNKSVNSFSSDSENSLDSELADEEEAEEEEDYYVYEEEETPPPTTTRRPTVRPRQRGGLTFRPRQRGGRGRVSTLLPINEEVRTTTFRPRTNGRRVSTLLPIVTTGAPEARGGRSSTLLPLVTAGNFIDPEGISVSGISVTPSYDDSSTTEAPEAAGDDVGNDGGRFNQQFAGTVRPFLRPDGRAPRVKSDLKALLANNGKAQRNPKAGRRVEQTDTPRFAKVFGLERTRAGKAIDESGDDNNNIINNINVINSDDDEPVVRPDGQKPRVKSDIKARLANRGNHAKAGHRVDGAERPRFDRKQFLKKLRSGKSIDDDAEGDNDVEGEDDDSPAIHVPQIRPDGQRPRVKSDLNRRLENGGPREPRIRPDGQRPRVKSDLRPRSRSEEFRAPEVRPDGQKPRVKSDLKARLDGLKRNKPGGSFRHSTKVDKEKNGIIIVNDDEDFFETTTVAATTATEDPFAFIPTVSSPFAVTFLEDHPLLTSQVLNTRALRTTEPTSAADFDDVGGRKRLRKRKRKKRKVLKKDLGEDGEQDSAEHSQSHSPPQESSSSSVIAAKLEEVSEEDNLV